MIDSRTTLNDLSTFCSKCGEKILNVMTADEHEIYHPDCFNCSDCGKTLAGRFFYKSKTIKTKDSFIESIHFCEMCYKRIAPKW